MTRSFKLAVRAVFLALAAPTAALSGFGRVAPAFTFWAHFWALVPGLPGDLLRTGYYKLTLASCALDCQIGFGSYFSQAQARVERGCVIGAYCVIGRARIGERCLVGSGVHVLSGQHQHARDGAGWLHDGQLTTIAIGADCWLGSGSIIMADIGARATVAAGAVVGTAVAAGATVSGNPARMVRVTAAAGPAA